MPKFALLAVSGFIMNFVVSWVRRPLVLPLLLLTPRERPLILLVRAQFHKDDDKKQAQFKEKIEKARLEQVAAEAACVLTLLWLPHRVLRLTLSFLGNRATETPTAAVLKPQATASPAQRRSSRRK